MGPLEGTEWRPCLPSAIQRRPLISLNVLPSRPTPKLAVAENTEPQPAPQPAPQPEDPAEGQSGAGGGGAGCGKECDPSHDPRGIDDVMVLDGLKHEYGAWQAQQ